MAILAGGALGLDAVSFPQAMVSRPLVAASLGGLWAGNASLGFWVGGLLELLWMRELPVGGARHADAAPAAFAAGAGYAMSDGSATTLLVALGIAIVSGWIGSWTVHALRRWNGALVAPLAGRPTPPANLVGRHLAALASDFGRAAGLTVLWIVLLRAFVARAQAAASVDAVAAGVLLLGSAAALGTALRTLVSGAAMRRAVALGVAACAAGLRVSG